MFKKSIILVIMVAILFIAMGNIATAQKNNEFTEISWSSVALGGSAHMLISAIAAVVNRAEPSLKITAQPTGGSLENPRLMQNKVIDICHTVHGYNAFHGKGPFEGEEPLDDIMFLFTLYENGSYFVTLENSDIMTLDDLKGKTVSFWTMGSAAKGWSEAILDAYGILDEVNPTYPGGNAQYDFLRDGSIDAAISYSSGNIPTPALYQADNMMNLRVLEMDEDKIRNIIEEKYPWYGITKITADSLECLDEDTIALADFSCQYADSRLSEEAAYKIVKAIYESIDEIKTYHSLGSTLSPEKALEGCHPDIPVHPGAAKYYKEIGVWRDNLKVGKIN